MCAPRRTDSSGDAPPENDVEYFKGAVASGGVLFRQEWPRCIASRLLPHCRSLSLPPFLLLLSPSNAMRARFTPHIANPTPLICFRRENAIHLFKEGKLSPFRRFPPLSQFSQVQRRGNNAASTFRSRLRRKMAMLVNDGQGPDRGRSANCVRSRRSAHSPFVPSSLYHVQKRKLD